MSEDTKIFHWAKFFAFKHGMKLVSDVQKNFISLYIEVYKTNIEVVKESEIKTFRMVRDNVSWSKRAKHRACKT